MSFLAKRKVLDINGFISAAVVLGVAVMIASGPVIHFTTQQTISNVTVKKTERVAQNGASKYLIFAEGETFENVDSWLALKFNSSDIYGRINAGDICEFDVVGLRMPLFSAYRNILDARCE